MEQQSHQVWEWQVILDQPDIRVVQSRRSQEGSQHLGSGGKLQEVSHFKLLQFQQPATVSSKNFAKVWKYPAWAHPVLMFGFPKPLEIWKFKSHGKLSKMKNNDQSLKNVANTITSVILYLDIRVWDCRSNIGKQLLVSLKQLYRAGVNSNLFLDFQLNKHDTDCTTVAGAIKLNCECTTISK